MVSKRSGLQRHETKTTMTFDIRDLPTDYVLKVLALSTASAMIDVAHVKPFSSEQEPTYPRYAAGSRRHQCEPVSERCGIQLEVAGDKLSFRYA